MSEARFQPVQANPEEIDEAVGLEEPAPGDLRRATARGTIINSAFRVGLAALSMLQRLIVAAFLTAEEYGLWGIVITAVVTLAWLKEIGIADKYVQQSEPDQERAFQKAFTLEILISAVFAALLAVALPIYAVAYGESEIIVPGLVLAAAVLITALESPIWVPYRRMEFLRQRILASVNPITAFIVTVSLAIAGVGYWCLVIGMLAGSVAGALVAVATSAYRLRWRFERQAVKEYASFSWPLIGFGVSNMLVVQGTLLIANGTVGLAGIGAIGLAGVIAGFADRVDGIIGQTIYPAVCRVVDRPAVMHEAFTKSNRVILMWAIPFGTGLALFAGDLVTFVLGEKWRAAEDLLIGIGLTVAVGQIAFNWAIFMRAVNDTKPIFFASLVGVGSFALFMVPALLTLDLIGYVVGLAANVVVQLALRGYYLRRLFPDFRLMRHIARALAPSVPAAGIILLLRLLMTEERTLGIALAEVALYVAATVLFTLVFERKLVREIVGYLRKSPPAGPGAVAAESPQPSRA